MATESSVASSGNIERRPNTGTSVAGVAMRFTWLTSSVLPVAISSEHQKTDLHVVRRKLLISGVV